MTQFSIVVPTMWKFEPFLNFLSDLVKLELVNEVIIINNNLEVTPLQHPALSHAKVKLHNFDKNIFVNPAFNFGVAVAENEHIVLMNDDIIFDFKALYRAAELVQPNRMLALSPNPELDKNVSGTAVPVKYEEGIDSFHFGACMFVNRSEWVSIPAGLDLYYGDNWIWETTLARGGEIFLIKDVFFSSPTSVTCGEMYTPLWLGREGHMYERLLKQFKERI